VTVVNALGDFKLSSHRLAFIDGDGMGLFCHSVSYTSYIDFAEDPWSQATPHSRYAPQRKDTIGQPFKWIKTGIHHYDQNGLKNHALEPPHIRNIHAQEVEFVKSWLEEDD
jgi:hypothetical protein